MAQIIDTPTEVRAWKQRMLRVAKAHNVTIPEGFDVDVPTMGIQARTLMHLLASHANGIHGGQVRSMNNGNLIQDNRTLNGGLQEWLLAVDPRLFQPIPAGHGSHIIGGLHPTAGLEGYPAYDFGAPAGAPVVACEAGRAYRFSGHNPAEGPIDGVHGPFGWSIYVRGVSGADYYYTHLQARMVYLNADVAAGTLIGLVGDYARWGGADHVHLGVKPPADGHPSIEDVKNAPLV